VAAAEAFAVGFAPDLVVGFGAVAAGLVGGFGLFFATFQLYDFGAQIAFFGEVAPVYDFKGFLFFVFRHGVSLGLLG
jgi:hypothetical protein